MEWLRDLKTKLFLKGAEKFLRAYEDSRYNPSNRVKWFDPADWKSLVIYAHGLPFYETIGLGNVRPTMHTVYEKLLPFAYDQMDSLGEGDFLYELALTREFSEFEPLLPLAFQELRLPPPYPLGVAYHLLCYISQLKLVPDLSLAFEVDRFLEDSLRHQPSVLVPPPEIDPILGKLFSAARRSWDNYDKQEKAEAQIEFDSLLEEVRTVYIDYAQANNYILPPEPEPEPNDT